MIFPKPPAVYTADLHDAHRSGAMDWDTYIKAMHERVYRPWTVHVFWGHTNIGVKLGPVTIGLFRCYTWMWWLFVGVHNGPTLDPALWLMRRGWRP